MRCLFITTELEGRGGIQFVGRLILRVLSEAYAPDARLTVVSVLDPPGSNPVYSTRGARGSRPRAVLDSLGLLLHKRWDLIILGHVHLSALLQMVKTLSSAPVIGLAYGIEVWRPINGLRRRGVRQVDHLLYISEHSRQAAYETNPWLKEVRDSVCHLGLGRQGAESGEQRAASGEDAEFALSIGRMSRGEQYKGHEEMIRAWPEVQRQRPGLQLVLIGDGDDRPRLKQIASEVQADVTFLGGVDDAIRDERLKACRCFCLPSRGEGFGLVYLEAMRESKPVLAGSVDAGREVVADRETGRTVDARNQAELVQGILDVSGERAAEMGAAGHSRYEQLFSYDAFANRFVDQIRAIVAASSE